VSFGPRFESEDEADRFLSWEFKNHGDPRQFNEAILKEHVDEFRSLPPVDPAFGSPEGWASTFEQLAEMGL
jgi:hypothetical protein